MIDRATYDLRRNRLLAAVDGPIVLAGSTSIPRNTPGHFLPFRQDSTFLYLTGCQWPRAVAVLSHESGFELFLPEPGADDELWNGPCESPRELGARLGADRVRPIGEAGARIEALHATGARLHTLPPADPVASANLAAWTGQRVEYGAPDAASGGGSDELVRTISGQRLIKDRGELAEMRAAAAVTRVAHLEALAMTRAGATEHDIAVRVQSVFLAEHCVEAYPSIVTVRGQVLHCPTHENTLENGQLLLVDAGAERQSGYGSDVTRTSRSVAASTPFSGTCTSWCFRRNWPRSTAVARVSSTATRTRPRRSSWLRASWIWDSCAADRRICWRPGRRPCSFRTGPDTLWVWTCMTCDPMACAPAGLPAARTETHHPTGSARSTGPLRRAWCSRSSQGSISCLPCCGEKRHAIGLTGWSTSIERSTTWTSAA